MRIVKGTVLVAVVALLAAAIAGVGLLAVVSGRALPQVSGTARVPGLGAAVSVVRDPAGIAHISADTGTTTTRSPPGRASARCRCRSARLPSRPPPSRR